MFVPTHSYRLKMNNRERDDIVESYHLYIALRRKKENRELKELCFRQIIRDEDMDLRILREKIRFIPGIWRIYKTVNARKVEPARRLLMKQLIDNPDHHEHRIDSLWKNCLLQRECKAEKNFMIDVVCEDIPDVIHNIILNSETESEMIKTPNGWHIICQNLDTRLLQGVENVEVKRDDIKFVELIENE